MSDDDERFFALPMGAGEPIFIFNGPFGNPVYETPNTLTYLWLLVMIIGEHYVVEIESQCEAKEGWDRDDVIFTHSPNIDVGIRTIPRHSKFGSDIWQKTLATTVLDALIKYNEYPDGENTGFANGRRIYRRIWRNKTLRRVARKSSELIWADSMFRFIT